MLAVGLDLAPQAVDVDHDGVVVHRHRRAPHPLVEHVLGEYLVGVLEEQKQQGALPGGQVQHLLPLEKAHGGSVIAEGAAAQLLGSGRGKFPAAPQQSLHLGSQYHRAEGLCDIVVCSQGQSVEGVVVLVAAADDDDRGLDPPLPQPAQHLKALHVSQIYVQQNDVKGACLQGLESLFSAAHRLGIHVVAAHHLFQQFADGRVVVHNEHLIRHVLSPFQAPEQTAQTPCDFFWNYYNIRGETSQFPGERKPL